MKNEKTELRLFVSLCIAIVLLSAYYLHLTYQITK